LPLPHARLQLRRAERAAAFLKHKLKDCEVTYADLAQRLKKHGFKIETEAALRISWRAGHSRLRGFSPFLQP
jgi:hypothetical protein